MEDENKNQSDSLNTEELLSLKNLLEDIQGKVNNVYDVLESKGLMDEGGNVLDSRLDRVNNGEENEEYATGEERIVEGVFDGQGMVGPDGKQYSVPANYASKSKLVEGDILKLTITPRGSFIYKQIEPIEQTNQCSIASHESRTRLLPFLHEHESRARPTIRVFPLSLWFSILTSVS